MGHITYFLQIGRDVCIHHISYIPPHLDLAGIQQNAGFAKILDTGHVMTDEQYGPPFTAAYVLHFANGFFLEFSITNGKNFVHDKDFRIKMSCDSKSKAHGHTGGIALYGSVYVALTTGEVHNFVQFSGYLGLGHSHNGAVHINIFATGHFRMEARTHFKESADASACADCADRRACNLG